MSVTNLIADLDEAIAAVDAGRKSESACITLVAPSMKGTGIRPEMVSETQSGERIYLLNVKQARKLRDRAFEALATQPSPDSGDER